MLAAIIDSLRRGVPAGLEELAQLGRTLHRRRADVLAYFDHQLQTARPKRSTVAWKPWRRNALGFRNLTHYRLRSLLHCGNLIQQINALIPEERVIGPVQTAGFSPELRHRHTSEVRPLSALFPELRPRPPVRLSMRRS
jgi:hypothetical protein